MSDWNEAIEAAATIHECIAAKLDVTAQRCAHNEIGGQAEHEASLLRALAAEIRSLKRPVSSPLGEWVLVPRELIEKFTALKVPYHAHDEGLLVLANTNGGIIDVSNTLTAGDLRKLKRIAAPSLDTGGGNRK